MRTYYVIYFVFSLKIDVYRRNLRSVISCAFRRSANMQTVHEFLLMSSEKLNIVAMYTNT